LQSGQSITHYEAVKMGIMGFNSCIKDLRDAGYPIVCTMKPFENKHGKTIKRGVFSLTQGVKP